MTDLTDLLNRASEPDSPMPDTADDLARARAARHRQMRRRTSWGAASAAALVAVTVGSLAVTGNDSPGSEPGDRQSAAPSPEDGVVLLSQPLEAGPYSFDTTPQGWHVLPYDHPEFATVIGPETGDQDPNRFAGKLVISLSHNRPSGEPREYEGRTYWVGDPGGDHQRITVMTRSGEPQAALEIQFPTDAGWSEATMLEFLSTVEVGDDAKAGIG
jgi:hypothetical protein